MNVNTNGLKTNFQFWGKKKEPVCNVKTSDLQDEDDDFDWSDSEFSDDETYEEEKDPNVIYNDIAGITYQADSGDGTADTEEYYENFTSDVVKVNEMRKTPPTLPPRKADIPKPPARCKKEKKPPLPEKINLDQEDNQFYEEMSQMTFKSPSPAPPAKKNFPPPLSRCQQNTNIREDEGGYAIPESSPDQLNDRKSVPSFTLAPRKMPAIPSMTSTDSTPSHKTSTSHSSVSTRPRIEPPSPKEKPSENPLNAFKWYHGDSERMVVEKKLLNYKMDGMFAVRNSKTKGPSYPHAVTLYQNGKTFNFPIRIRDSDKRFALGTEKINEPSFESLSSLIEYFKTNKIKLMNNQSAMLNIPLDRSS